MIYTKRLLATALGVVLTILAIPAEALNGYINVAACPGCVTSADFQNAAIAQAKAVMASGTYLLSSTVVAESAYMQVTGHLKNVGDGSANPVWVFTGVTATPIDSLGISLATESESALETFFSALDTNTMGVSRDFPIVLGPIKPGQTQSAMPDYFTSTDNDIWLGVAADSITNNTNLLAELKPGDTITITWQYTLSGTITAIFQVITDQNGNLTLKWVSATKNGNPINRDGTPKSNSNTAGSGGGSASVGGFGASGSRYNFDVIGGQACLSTTTVVWGDLVSYWAGFVPC